MNRPRARPELVLRKAADEWLLFDADGTELHVMNLSAALVWAYCTGEFTAADITARLAEAYPAQPRGSLAEEVHGVLQQFAEAGLLCR